ncbi:cysteine--tRNA ligase [Dictyobacter aurantiacus]|uniref:Cysteine--tRNA ligase n=1 Tax=Dictyobacter aurantiacus TaxID=1936993 RepID=A0A401ZDS8_9CHLR|nr:cysteine--tRNA ligase [Dictyobacter aurantiacus]GCE05041.1 cysteine--tRNA ligase [Dictyobacter aurantiacus]
MKLFNTLTQSLQEFKPIGDTVTIYVCGVTPYDTTHLGHAFTYITFDTLIRYLEYKGHTVKYVQNVTDVDDDVIRKAGELGIAWDELGNREIERFLGEMDSLNWRRPDVYARATDEIERIIKLTQALIERGLAYESEGCVFYSVREDKDFGKMAQAVGLNDYQSMLAIANERGNFPDDKRKRDPLDFVLWQAKAPGEPSWESPWGPGRPGWHIECSSMSMHYLGEQIDIHGGGADLTFPHHTCEIAQSEHYSGKAPFVNTWMHVGMVYQDGEKMSKSLGNLTLVRNLLKEYSADAIRIVLQSHHYRYPWECFPQDLKIAAETAYFFTQVREMVGQRLEGEDNMLHNRFIAAMENDLNTPEAILLLRHAAQDALQGRDRQLGSEVLRLAGVLGLTA